MEIKYFKKHPEAVSPQYMNPGDVGADLVTVDRKVIFCFGEPIVVYDTGLIIIPPEGINVKLAARSSISTKTNLFLANSIGVIDREYRGTLKFYFKLTGFHKPIDNHELSRAYLLEDDYLRLTYVDRKEGAEEKETYNYFIVYKVGERIGQMLLERLEIANSFTEVHYAIKKTVRGSGGFGSTDTEGATHIDVFTKEYFDKRKPKEFPDIPRDVMDVKGTTYELWAGCFEGKKAGPEFLGSFFAYSFERAISMYIAANSDVNLEEHNGHYYYYGARVFPTYEQALEDCTQ